MPLNALLVLCVRTKSRINDCIFHNLLLCAVVADCGLKILLFALVVVLTSQKCRRQIVKGLFAKQTTVLRKSSPFTICQGGVFRPQTVSTSEHKNRYLLQINILYSCYNYFKHYVKISLIVFFKHNIVAIFFNDMIGYLCFFH